MAPQNRYVGVKDFFAFLFPLPRRQNGDTETIYQSDDEYSISTRDTSSENNDLNGVYPTWKCTATTKVASPQRDTPSPAPAPANDQTNNTLIECHSYAPFGIQRDLTPVRATMHRRSRTMYMATRLANRNLIDKIEKDKEVSVAPLRHLRAIVCIFDLDDTLIPTDWIRTTFNALKATLRHRGNSKYLYQCIRKELDELTQNKLVRTICETLLYAREVFGFVAVVTNAKSVGWINVVDSMFPEIRQLLRKYEIPLKRTEPLEKEPTNVTCISYFNYWKNAKKKEFLRFAEEHQESLCDIDIKTIKKSCFDGRVDLVSIGDNDFEDVAASELVHHCPDVVRASMIARCQSGLNPKKFVNQLQDISQAIKILSKPTFHTRKLLNVGSHVTIRIVE